MTPSGKKYWRYYLKLAGWVLLVQLLLANISASIYAYKFTHFYQAPAVAGPVQQNLFDKTWKLFVGPSFYKNTSEPLPNFPVDTVHFQTSGGIDISSWYSQADSAQACVIFFHGLSVNKSFMNDEAAMFRSWGYNVMQVDLRAHGQSGGQNISFGVSETEEVEKAFAYAKQRGNNKIILYGMSLGAAICLRAVSEKSIEPAAIIADMPFHTLHQHLKSRARVLGFPSEPFAGLVTLWMGWERGYNGFRHDVGRYASEVTCPVLLEWGTADPFVQEAEIDSIFVRINSKKKSLLKYPEAGHESLLKADPNRWKNGIKAFLDSL